MLVLRNNLLILVFGSASLQLEVVILFKAINRLTFITSQQLVARIGSSTTSRELENDINKQLTAVGVPDIVTVGVVASTPSPVITAAASNNDDDAYVFI